MKKKIKKLDETATCANCAKNYRLDQLDEYKDFWSRVEVGGEIPAGDCPECGAFAYLDKPAPLPTIEARVRPFDDQSGRPSKLMAFGEIIIGGAFVIKGIRILKRDDPADEVGPFVVFPAEKGKGAAQDRWFDVAHPVTPAAREESIKAVLAAYETATSAAKKAKA